MRAHAPGDVSPQELDLEIKYMTSVQGSDMGSKGRELAQHFEENGCPVMIGGNNLACGNFDIVLGMPHIHPHRPCSMVYLVP